jgi:hypothetical protein
MRAIESRPISKEAKSKKMARPTCKGRMVPWLFAAVLVCVCAVVLHTALADEPTKELVGIIEGDAISIQGPMTIRVIDGQAKTILRSGGDVHVKSGRATIDLVEGGKIAVCGPAHFSVLKSPGALTVALDSGVIHTYVDHEPALTVYTALLQAKPISIGGAAQDTIVGLDAQGSLSIRAIAGAVRIEHQLTGQSVLLPQNSDLLLVNGQMNDLRPGAGRAACELGELKIQQPLPQVSVPATAEEVQQRRLTKSKLPAANSSTTVEGGPTYQVFLPPMRYDANLKVQPAPDPSLIVLVRRVRVRPTLIFQGKVEGDPIVAENRPAPALPAAKSNATPAAQSKPPTNNPTVVNRVRTFIKRLWNSNS